MRKSEMEEKNNPEYRNMHPHAEAEIARIMYSEEYAAQDGGTIEFWYSLSFQRKEYCACLVDEIVRLPRYANYEEYLRELEQKGRESYDT